MPALDGLHREAAFQTAATVPARVLRPHAAGGRFGAESGGGSTPGNLRVQGHNPEALKALLPFHRGRVKCIYIDAPRHTRGAFLRCDHDMEDSRWLSTMPPRPGGCGSSCARMAASGSRRSNPGAAT